MADTFSKAKRSAIMAAVRSHGNRLTELRLIEVLRAHKIIGWRRRQRVFGRPDFVFSHSKLAIFVDGCFWHGCRVHGGKPKHNAAFWVGKITRNQTRDRLVVRTLRQNGWRVLRIWQHELTRNNERRLVARLCYALNKSESNKGMRPTRFVRDSGVGETKGRGKKEHISN